LGRFAQMPAGRTFNFQVVTMAEAQAEARAMADLLRTLPGRAREIGNPDIVDALQNANIAGSAVNAFDGGT
jgi:hypothetical protein